MIGLISVVIPTYNRATTLLAAAQSVLRQTYKDLELIIVDDGSTDNTASVVESLQDERVRYISLECNQGACAARNRGIKESRGEYIAFQDSDDIWHSNKLEVELDYLHRENADVVFCAIHRYEVGSFTPKVIPVERGALFQDSKKLLNILLTKNVVSMVTVLCNRTCAEQIGFDETIPRRQDWDWAIRVAQRYKMCYLDQVLVESYIQEDSISQSTKKFVDALHIMRKKYSQEIESFPSIKKKWDILITEAEFNMGLPVGRKCIKTFFETGKWRLGIKGLLCFLGLQKFYLAYRSK